MLYWIGCFGARNGVKFGFLSEAAEVITIVGSKGAGKSTILRGITGLIKPRQGSITFEDRRIDALSPGRIVPLGMSMVPEGRELFPRMTVREHLELAAAYVTPAERIPDCRFQM